MKILGKSVSTKFQAFYRNVIPQIDVPVRFERAPFHAMGDYLLENGVARIRLDTNMSRPHFEYTVAHEIIHALQDTELWPGTVRKYGLPENSDEAVVGSELGALVRDLNVEDRLRPLGFDSNYSNDIRYKNSKKNLAVAEVPNYGTLMWILWTLRYTSLFFTQPASRWKKLKELYLKRVPKMIEKGDEMISLLKKHGWSSPDEALASLIAIRDSLGVTKEQVIVEDRRTMRRY